MALFRSSSGGGSESKKSAAGSFTTNTSATTGYKVTLGFKPAYICIVHTVSAYNMIYNSDISTTKYSRGTASANAWRNLETNTNAYSIKSIDDDGFTVFTASTYSSGTWDYFAIEE